MTTKRKNSTETPIKKDNGVFQGYFDLLEKIKSLTTDQKNRIKYFAHKYIDKVKFELTISSPFIIPFLYKIPIAQGNIDTIGVEYKKENRRMRIIYNPFFIYWIGSLNKELDYIRFILIHEYYHVIHNHLTTRSYSEHNRKLINVAQDLAINSILARDFSSTNVEVPYEIGCFPGYNRFEKYPPLQITESYITLLQNDPEMEALSQEQLYCLNFDNHGDLSGESEGNGLGSPSEFDEILLKGDIEQLIKEALSMAHGKAAGDRSCYTNQTIELFTNLVNKPDPYSVLRYFLNKSIKGERYSTYKRVNKRFPYKFPGRSRRKQSFIAISVDQSGSVNEEMLKKFFAFIDMFIDVINFTIIPFDSLVDEENIYEYKKNGAKPEYKRHRYGGTNFNAPTEYVNDAKKYDGHIILTDLEAPAPKKSLVPRIWVTQQGCSNDAISSVEKVIEIN